MTTNELTEENCRREILEIIRLCNISKMPEKIGEFIEESVSVEQAREVLMELLAERTKKTEILSAIPQNSGEELMMQVARSRRHLKYITKGEKQNEYYNRTK